MHCNNLGTKYFGKVKTAAHSLSNYMKSSSFQNPVHQTLLATKTTYPVHFGRRAL
ncbi:unnamed protein product, partial [Acanthoscelides obtectus]